MPMRFLRALDAPASAEPVSAGAREPRSGRPPMDRPGVNQSQFPGFAPLPPPAPAMPPQYGVPVASALPPSLRNAPLTRAERKALRRAWREGGSSRSGSSPRGGRGSGISQHAGTLRRHNALSVGTQRRHVATLFLGDLPRPRIGVDHLHGGGRLWSHSGVSPREVFRPLPEIPSMRLSSSTGEGAFPGAVPERVPSASSLASATVLAGPFGAVVRRAAFDRDRVHRRSLLVSIDTSASRCPMPKRRRKGLARSGRSARSGTPPHERRVPALPAQALADRRSALTAQMDRASIMLQTLCISISSASECPMPARAQTEWLGHPTGQRAVPRHRVPAGCADDSGDGRSPR